MKHPSEIKEKIISDLNKSIDFAQMHYDNENYSDPDRRELLKLIQMVTCFKNKLVGR